MLFRQDILEGIVSGRVTVAFRRWRRTPPAVGATLRTSVGVLVLDRVSVIEEGDITPDDVRRTGMTVEDLRRSIGGEGTLLRIDVRLLGDDPRIALRNSRPASDELDRILARLARLDAAAPTPWTRRYLELIAGRPETVARVLAQAVGAELLAFKRRVRELKDLGLTESLEVGYRLAPRGAAVLAHLAGGEREDDHSPS